MVKEEYTNAYVEVLEVLKQLNKEDFSKIPKEYIMYLEENSNKYFSFRYDLSKPLKDQNISENAKLILFFLFEKFGANEKQKKKINDFKANIIAQNEKEKAEKYNYDDLFKKRNHQNRGIQENEQNKIENVNNKLVIQNNTNIFLKIINYIKNIFKRKR